jgi:HAD superfamily hydrolase (TIGR01509 family)
LSVAAVILDCDGVLVDSEVLAGPILAEILTELGLPTTRADVDRDFKGRSWEDGLAVIEERLGGPPWPDLRERYRARLFAAFDERLRAVAGIEAALDAIALPCCVASSGDHERIRRGLAAAGLLARFPDEAIFSVDDVPRGKPAPDLFLHAAARMGFAPARTVVVEDSPAGVAAGRAAGMQVLGYAARTPAPILEAAGATAFAAMADLPRLLTAPGGEIA